MVPFFKTVIEVKSQCILDNANLNINCDSYICGAVAKDIQNIINAHASVECSLDA